MEAVPITFECECGRKLKAADDKAGRAFRCPACGTTVKVPPPESVAAAFTEEEPESDNSHNLDEEEVPADNISSELASAPSVADDADAPVGALPPRLLPTPPPFGESVRASVSSQPSGAGSGTRRASGGENTRSLRLQTVYVADQVLRYLKANRDGVTAIQGSIIIVLLLIGLGAPFFGVLRPTPKWEYKVEGISDLRFDVDMKVMGNEGWELVTARRAGSEYSVKYEMIFKRPK